MQNAQVSASIEKSAGVSKMSHVVQSSTSVKLVDEASRVAKTMDVTSGGSPVKGTSNVDFGIDESLQGLVGSVCHLQNPKKI